MTMYEAEVDVTLEALKSGDMTMCNIVVLEANGWPYIFVDAYCP